MWIHQTVHLSTVSCDLQPSHFPSVSCISMSKYLCSEHCHCETHIITRPRSLWTQVLFIKYFLLYFASPNSFASSLQIFSIVVFGSIVNEGYINIGSERLYCVYNKNNDACNFGITTGIIAFLGCLFFLFLDMKFQQISSIKDRKKAVMVEIGFSGKAPLPDL